MSTDSIMSLIGNATLQRKASFTFERSEVERSELLQYYNSCYHQAAA